MRRQILTVVDPGIVRRFLVLEVDPGGTVGFVAYHEIERRRAPLLGVVHHADGVVGRKHQLHVPGRQVAIQTVCQLPPVRCGRDMAIS